VYLALVVDLPFGVPVRPFLRANGCLYLLVDGVEKPVPWAALISHQVQGGILERSARTYTARAGSVLTEQSGNEIFSHVLLGVAVRRFAFVCPGFLQELPVIGFAVPVLAVGRDFCVYTLVGL
jgi:hypothetical protein